MDSRQVSSGDKLGQLIGDWFARGGAPGFINLSPLGLKPSSILAILISPRCYSPVWFLKKCSHLEYLITTFFNPLYTEHTLNP
jgi:hypothetical protein